MTSGLCRLNADKCILIKFSLLTCLRPKDDLRWTKTGQPFLIDRIEDNAYLHRLVTRRNGQCEMRKKLLQQSPYLSPRHMRRAGLLVGIWRHKHSILEPSLQLKFQAIGTPQSLQSSHCVGLESYRSVFANSGAIWLHVIRHGHFDIWRNRSIDSHAFCQGRLQVMHVLQLLKG